jgi:hypothetical protein
MEWCESLRHSASCGSRQFHASMQVMGRKEVVKVTWRVPDVAEDVHLNTSTVSRIAVACQCISNLVVVDGVLVLLPCCTETGRSTLATELTHIQVSVLQMTSVGVLLLST